MREIILIIIVTAVIFVVVGAWIGSAAGGI